MRSMETESSRVRAPSSNPYNTWLWMSINVLILSHVLLSMNRKLPWGTLGWAMAGLLGLAAAFTHAQNSQPAAGAAGRFQLFTASNGTFRVDTETGETAIYREGSMPPAGAQPQYRFNYWQRVDDRWIIHDQLEEARQAMSAPR
jgi:hypothetical protein